MVMPEPNPAMQKTRTRWWQGRLGVPLLFLVFPLLRTEPLQLELSFNGLSEPQNVTLAAILPLHNTEYPWAWPRVGPALIRALERQRWSLLRLSGAVGGRGPQVLLRPVGLHRAWLRLRFVSCGPLHHPLGRSHGDGRGSGHRLQHVHIHHQHGPHTQEAGRVWGAPASPFWLAQARHAHVQRQQRRRPAILLYGRGAVHAAAAGQHHHSRQGLQ
ncbi:unnamed protein product [Oncorhynchus mykiss]|uniref:Uncharacterized protein n=1 Tax=Oncorhynchus mykiss TaxID=8022 RepID=A0A060XFQ3_ONCMY|nr:unnamed protein product [Oncorhynchus mykiss]